MIPGESPSAVSPPSAAPTAAAAVSRDAALIPLPFWWARRIGVALLALLVLLAVLWVAWAVYARRQYNAAVAEARALGEIVFPEDLLALEMPPDNAIPLLLAAGEACDFYRSLDPSFSQALGEWTDSTFRTPVPEALHAGLDDLDAPLRSLNRMPDLPNAAWPPEIAARPWARAASTQRSMLVALANTMRASAARAADRGDVLGALRAAELALIAAERCAAATTVEYGHALTAGLFVDVAFDTLEYTLPGIFEESWTGRCATLDEQLLRIQHLISDESSRNDLARNLIRAFRLRALSEIQEFSTGSTPRSEDAAALLIPVILLKPAADLDAARVFRIARPLEALLRRDPDSPRLSLAPVFPRGDEGLYLIAHPIFDPLMMVPRLGRYTCEIDAQRRLATLGIAAARFRCRHGKLPPAPEDLVPEFISDVPFDPFTSPPEPLLLIGTTTPPCFHIRELDAAAYLAAPDRWPRMRSYIFLNDRLAPDQVSE